MILRSLLFVPGNKESMLGKALGLRPDAFVPDMEDSVPAAEKANAREAIRSFLPQLASVGVPVIPRAWLLTAARRKAIDRIRRRALFREKQREILALEASLSAPAPDELLDRPAIEDDRLRLAFTCCHPALPQEAQVALALRTLLGLTTVVLGVAILGRGLGNSKPPSGPELPAA